MIHTATENAKVPLRYAKRLQVCDEWRAGATTAIVSTCPKGEAFVQRSRRALPSSSSV